MPNSHQSNKSGRTRTNRAHSWRANFAFGKACEERPQEQPAPIKTSSRASSRHSKPEPIELTTAQIAEANAIGYLQMLRKLERMDEGTIGDKGIRTSLYDEFYNPSGIRISNPVYVNGQKRKFLGSSD